MYLVQVQDITDNQNPFTSVMNEYVVWRTKLQTKHRIEAVEAKEILQKYYIKVRIMVTREAVELADDMQELL